MINMEEPEMMQVDESLEPPSTVDAKESGTVEIELETEKKVEVGKERRREMDKQNNKRLFNNLLGTLKVFKKESVMNEKLSKRNELIIKIQEKLLKEKQEFNLNQAQKEKEKELVGKKELKLKEELEKQKREKVVRKYEAMFNLCCFTETIPKISYRYNELL